MTIDWSKPVVAVKPGYPALRRWAMRDGDVTAENSCDVWVEGWSVPVRVDESGVIPNSSWRLRNYEPGEKFKCPPMPEWMKGMGQGSHNRPNPSAPEHPTPTQYPPKLVERMVALVRVMSSKLNDDHTVNLHGLRENHEEARSIVSDLPQEVDPDEQEAQRLVAKGWSSTDPDYRGVMELAKEALALGRQLQRGEAA